MLFKASKQNWSIGKYYIYPYIIIYVLMPVKSLIHNFYKIYYLLLLHLKILYI